MFGQDCSTWTRQFRKGLQKAVGRDQNQLVEVMATCTGEGGPASRARLKSPVYGCKGYETNKVSAG